jgi:AraC-like DNA-binding protein
VLFLSADALGTELLPEVQRSIQGETASLVVRALSPFLPGPELRAVFGALEDVRKTRDAEGFAARAGFSRAFLSERFKRWGLPSIGQFLLWCRLLHAARWLDEPGRSGQSVARQLGYADGAGFRRALRTCTGLTPTELLDAGGFDHLLRIFMGRHGFVRPPARQERETQTAW